MLPALVGVLYLPVAAWGAVGVALCIALRRSPPVVVLRLAATFLALWAILATTVLVWVLANGGAAAIVQLLRAPASIFEPQWEDLWVAGALGALLVFAVAFAINQAVGRGFLRLLNPHPIPWPAGLLPPAQPIRLLAYSAERPEAFSFTLLERGGSGGWGLHRQEVILLSDGLLSRLTVEEREAAIGHEYGHLRGLDGRYLTFFRTLARMMRWDPVVGYIARSLTRREEYRADREAARLTGRPLALARALFKASMSEDTVRLPAGVAGFLGGAGRRGRRETVERIRRLVELSDSGDFPKEPRETA